MRAALIAALLLAAPGVASQPPAPSERIRTGDKQQSAEEIGDVASKNESTPSPTLPSAVIDQANSAQDRDDQKGESSSYNWEAVGVLLTFLVGVLQFYVMRRQAAIAKKQNEIINTQTTHMESGLDVARDSANAAIKAANAAEVQAAFTAAQKRVGDRQLEQMDESLKISRLNAESAGVSAAAAEEQAKRTAAALEEAAAAARVQAGVAVRQIENMDRPWLGVKIEVLQQPRQTQGQPMAVHFRVSVTNVGRSAAQHVMLAVDIVADENTIDPMGEVTRVINALPKTGIIGHVIIPTGELVREFILQTEPLSRNGGVTPTIFGGVRYTHGRAAGGSGLPSPLYHTTTFGFRVKAKNNIGSSVHNEDGTQTWFWDAEVETSARDFHHAD